MTVEEYRVLPLPMKCATWDARRSVCELRISYFSDYEQSGQSTQIHAENAFKELFAPQRNRHAVIQRLRRSPCCTGTALLRRSEYRQRFEHIPVMCIRRLEACRVRKTALRSDSFPKTARSAVQRSSSFGGIAVLESHNRPQTDDTRRIIDAGKELFNVSDSTNSV